MKLIILQGIPASGKSTWANEYMKTAVNTVIVSKDAIRHSFGEYNIKHDKEVEKIEMKQMRDALSAGKDVINDATNLNPKVIARLENLAKEYGAEVEFKKFDIMPKEAIKRDKNPDRAHHVGAAVINWFYSKYYNPSTAEAKQKKEKLKTVDHYRLPIDTSLPTAVMCDLDGTAAWMQNRSPFSTTEVDKDKADPQLTFLLGMLMDAGIEVIFISGRMDKDPCRELTLKWIREHVPHCSTGKLSGIKDNFILFMRKDNDWRGDEIVKKEIFENEIKGKFNVIAVFDDRNKVVNMWRETGLLCCQVAEGDF